LMAGCGARTGLLADLGEEKPLCAASDGRRAADLAQSALI
jgi:hypothetical protein